LTGHILAMISSFAIDSLKLNAKSIEREVLEINCLNILNQILGVG